jgi:hypothetical protein
LSYLRNLHHSKSGFDFVDLYDWKSNTTPLELESLQPTINLIFRDEILRKLRKAKDQKSIMKILIDLQEKYPTQPEINKTILRKTFVSNRTEGLELLKLYCDQSERPFYIQDQFKFLRISDIIHCCVKTLNSDVNERSLDKLFIINNISELLFPVIHVGSEYLDVSDYNYILERFQIFYNSCPPRYCTLLTNPFLKKARETGDKNLISRVIQLVKKLSDTRGITVNNNFSEHSKYLLSA